jgi:hypothetical protein
MQCPVNFGYNPAQKRFIVEASSLLAAGRNTLFEPIYDNGASDEGLCVPLAGTSELARFQVSSIVAEARIIQKWTLIPTRDTVERIPDLHGHTMILYNS